MEFVFEDTDRVPHGRRPTPIPDSLMKAVHESALNGKAKQVLVRSEGDVTDLRRYLGNAQIKDSYKIKTATAHDERGIMFIFKAETRPLSNRRD